MEEMRKYFPDMKVTYKPDKRQAIGEDCAVDIAIGILPVLLLAMLYQTPIRGYALTVPMVLNTVKYVVCRLIMLIFLKLINKIV